MKLGYLSPSGKMYDCNSSGHMDLAMRICNSLKPIYELRNSVDCEQYLLNLGYVCFRSHSVEYNTFTDKKFSKHFNVEECVNILTLEQQVFIEKLFKDNKWFNTDQIDAVTNILEYDKMMKETPLINGEVINPLNNSDILQKVVE